MIEALIIVPLITLSVAFWVLWGVMMYRLWRYGEIGEGAMLAAAALGGCLTLALIIGSATITGGDHAPPT